MPIEFFGPSRRISVVEVQDDPQNHGVHRALIHFESLTDQDFTDAEYYDLGRQYPRKWVGSYRFIVTSSPLLAAPMIILEMMEDIEDALLRGVPSPLAPGSDQLIRRP